MIGVDRLISLSESMPGVYYKMFKSSKLVKGLKTRKYFDKYCILLNLLLSKMFQNACDCRRLCDASVVPVQQENNQHFPKMSHNVML